MADFRPISSPLPPPHIFAYLATLPANADLPSGGAYRTALTPPSAALPTPAPPSEHTHYPSAISGGSGRSYNSLIEHPQYWLGPKTSPYADLAATEQPAYRTGEAPRIITLRPQKPNRPRVRRHRAASSIYSTASHPKLVTPASTAGRSCTDAASHARAYADLLPAHQSAPAAPQQRRSLRKKLKGFFKTLSCFS